MSGHFIERELVLIPNTLINERNISHAHLLELTTQPHWCELGSPPAPEFEDYKPALLVSQAVKDRLDRYRQINPIDVVGTIISSRVDVAGNLVGGVRILDTHAKAASLKKALMKPKCGLVIHPRIGLRQTFGNNYEACVFGFDLGFK